MLFLLGGGTAAQGHPDLSGRWILENASAASSDVARELTVQQVERTTSVIGGPLKEPVTYLTIQRRFATTSRIDRYEPVGVVGGTVEGLSGQPGKLSSTSRYSTNWEGRVLVINTAESHEAREEKWSLEDAALILTVTTRASGSESTTRLVYRRQ